MDLLLMLKSIKTITDAKELSKTTPVVLVLTGDDCSPCSRLKETLANMDLDKYNLDLCTVNITANPKEARALGIRSVPVTLSLLNGLITGTLIGEQPKEKIDTFLSNIV